MTISSASSAAPSYATAPQAPVRKPDHDGDADDSGVKAATATPPVSEASETAGTLLNALA